MRYTEQWIAIKNATFWTSKTGKTPQKTVFEPPQL